MAQPDRQRLTGMGEGAVGIRTRAAGPGRGRKRPDYATGTARQDVAIGKLDIFTVRAKGGKDAPKKVGGLTRTVRYETEWLPVPEDEGPPREIQVYYPPGVGDMPSRLCPQGCAIHQSVLLGALSLAGVLKREFYEAEPETGIVVEDRTLVSGATYRRVRIRTTTAALLKASGLSVGGPMFKVLPEVLKGLWQISYAYRHQVGNRFVEYRGEPLITYELVGDTGELDITLAERFARIFFVGHHEGRWPRHLCIDLGERNALSGEIAKLLHNWLSCNVWTGRTATFWPDTLAGHVYPAGTVINSPKRFAVRGALDKLGRLPGWRVQHLPDGKVSVTRGGSISVCMQQV
ncbi:replication protein C, IncQ-type [Azospirillum sp. TSO5]|uniref:replication protein C, IncQ-type n=1 Tax=Azospirillum sp. TSO5 TaxID=716760 RepID=UPI000D61CBB7|nr:replication protein C, IncQ-type [Azospirillum sp. TSO5]PWC92880.1 hypothetical protein TSO5_15730 [Azospirillum sp. TSO5]